MRILALMAVAVIVMLLLGGCTRSATAPATLMPTAAANADERDAGPDESPRTTEEGPSSMIPPTWTPGPSADDIPAQEPALPTRRPPETYTVQPGDTLAEIAAEYGVDLQRLATANDIVNIDFIFTGQVLTIPR